MISGCGNKYKDKGENPGGAVTMLLSGGSASYCLCWLSEKR